MANYNAIRYNHDFAGNAGNLTLLSTFTSDGSDATASFTSGIDSTYEEYLLVLNNIHPQTNGTTLAFQTTIEDVSENRMKLIGVAKQHTEYEYKHTQTMCVFQMIIGELSHIDVQGAT